MKHLPIGSISQIDKFLKDNKGIELETMSVKEKTVDEYLTFIGKMQGISSDGLYEKLAEVIEKCGLKEKKNAEISTLSKGYRREPESHRLSFIILKLSF